jgi:chitodextrinase/regulation of enolase protein 1 (concanavalin A-like superfamily)
MPVAFCLPSGRRAIFCFLTAYALLLAALLSLRAQGTGAWLNQDVGAVTTPGSTAYDVANNIFTLQGAGADIYGSADAFQFAYQPMTGDGQIIARVASQRDTHVSAKAGVMFRNNLNAGSAHFSLLVTPSKGVSLARRLTQDASVSNIATVNGAVAVWLKLCRFGNVFYAYTSNDGVHWTLVGQDTVVMSQTIYVGLAVASHNTAKVGAATFDGVQTQPKSDGQSPSAPAGVSVSYKTDCYADLRWNDSSDDFVVTGYEIYRDGAKVGTSPTARFTDTGLAAQTAYSYTVRAKDAAGHLSAFSPPLSVTTQANWLPSPWSHRDLGTPAAVNLGGGATFDSATGTYRINGAGADFWGSSDSGHFAWRTLSGNGWIIARLRSQAAAVGWAKAGLQLRESLDPASKHVSAFLTPGNGVQMLWRDAPGDSSNTAAGVSYAPVWLKLGRNGSSFSAYYSADGLSWTLIGSRTVSMATSIYAGLAITSRDNAQLSSASFDNLSVVPGITDAQLPTVPSNVQQLAASDVSVTMDWNPSSDDVAVSRYQVFRNGSLLGSTSASVYTDIQAAPGTSYNYAVKAVDGSGKLSALSAAAVGTSLASAVSLPWRHADIGLVGLAGTASASGSAVNITASGQDIWDESDSAHFVYQTLSGDGSIVARVNSLFDGDGGVINQWSKAGVEIRSSLTDNSAHAMMAITPENGATFQWRASAGASTSMSTQAGPTAPYWVKLMRQGNVFSAFKSVNGTTWTLVGSAAISMPANVCIGLIATAHQNDALCNAYFDSISLSGAVTNQAPTVSLTAPASGSSYFAPAAITLQANAADADGAVVKVEFYQGANVKIGESAAAPFSFNWTNVPAGTYALKAKATDNLGAASVLSAGVNVTMGTNPDADGNELPDAWETAHFGHTGVDPNADPDGDGLSNWQEYQQGLNPNDFYNGKTPALAKYSGDNQMGPPGGFVPAPLVVQVSDSNGVPIVNGPVTFTVSQGGGTVQKSSSATPVPSLTLRADGNGQVKVYFKLPNTQNSTSAITATSGGDAHTAQVTFTESSNDGSGHYASPFDASDVVATLHADGSMDVSWVNNVDTEDKTPIPIRYMNQDGQWVTLTTVPAGTTSVHLPNP